MDMVNKTYTIEDLREHQKKWLKMFSRRKTTWRGTTYQICKESTTHFLGWIEDKNNAGLLHPKDSKVEIGF